jgi:hypothetical protein
MSSTYPYPVYYKTPASAAYGGLSAEGQFPQTVSLPKQTTHFDLVKILQIGKQCLRQTLTESLKIVPLLAMSDLIQAVCYLTSKFVFTSELVSHTSLFRSFIQLPSQTALFMLVRAALQPAIKAIYKNTKKWNLEAYTTVRDLMVETVINVHNKVEKEEARRRAAEEMTEEEIEEYSEGQDLFGNSNDVANHNDNRRLSEEYVKSTESSSAPSSPRGIKLKKAKRISSVSANNSPVGAKRKKIKKSSSACDIPETRENLPPSPEPSPLSKRAISRSPKNPRIHSSSHDILSKDDKPPIPPKLLKAFSQDNICTRIPPETAPSDKSSSPNDELHMKAATYMAALGVVYLVGRIQNRPVRWITCVAIVCLQHLVERLNCAVKKFFPSGLAKLL